MASHSTRDDTTHHAPPSANRDPLLKLAEASAYLSVSPRFVRGEQAAGRLAVVRLGRNVRYRVSDLEHYLSERARTAGTQDRA